MASNPFADRGIWHLSESHFSKLLEKGQVILLNPRPNVMPGDRVTIRTPSRKDDVIAEVFAVSPHPMKEGRKRFMYYDVVLRLSSKNRERM